MTTIIYSKIARTKNGNRVQIPEDRLDWSERLERFVKQGEYQTTLWKIKHEMQAYTRSGFPEKNLLTDN